MAASDRPFLYVPLGPWEDTDGREYCCGLWCGRPCPYGLKIKPGAAQAVPVAKAPTEE